MSASKVLIRAKLRKAKELLRESRLEEARTLYAELCNNNRHHCEAWLELAVINRRLSQYQDAIACCEQVLTVQPASYAAQMILGTIWQLRGHVPQATQYYDRALASRPDDAEPYYLYANMLRETGDYGRAEGLYRDAIKKDPDYLAAIANLGTMLLSRGRYTEALEFLERAVQLAPANLHVLCNMAEYHLVHDRYDQALVLARKAWSLDQCSFDANYLLARIYRATGQYDEAIAHLEAIGSVSPDNNRVDFLRAEIEEIRGNYAAAMQLIEPYLRGDHPCVEALTVCGAVARNLEAGSQQQACDYIESLLPRAAGESQQYADLHRALGSLYDKRKEYDRAFQHYREANEIAKRSQPEFFERYIRNPENFRLAERLTAFRKEFWEGVPESRSDSDVPLFIVGMPRSGTTLLEQMLASHPEVYGAGELTGVSRVLDYFRANYDPTKRGYPGMLERVTAQAMTGMSQAWLGWVPERPPGTRRVVDKMPTNYRFIGLMRKLFPNGRIVHIRRNAVDTCLSIYFQRFSIHAAPATCDLGAIADTYRDYRAIMAYWDRVMPGQALHVRYEDLVADTEETLRRILDFCCLGWDARCLQFHATRRDVNTPSYHQVRQPIYRTSVARWRRYEAHLAVLLERLGDYVED